MLLVAKAENASPTQVAYTSFEADSPMQEINGSFVNTDPLGWVYDPRPAGNHLQLGVGVTGRRYYRLDQGWGVSRGNISPGEYEVTFWLQDDAGRAYIHFSPNSGDMEIGNRTQGPVRGDGYRLVRARIRINQGSASNPTGSINIDATSTPVNIDEVRLYPVGAQMTTYTHDPAVGITTTSDTNCEPTYYEYDGLQRLRAVRDARGNLRKHYEYNYQQ
jgi:YD repeat-containing protein